MPESLGQLIDDAVPEPPRMIAVRLITDGARVRRRRRALSLSAVIGSGSLIVAAVFASGLFSQGVSAAGAAGPASAAPPSSASGPPTDATSSEQAHALADGVAKIVTTDPRFAGIQIDSHTGAVTVFLVSPQLTGHTETLLARLSTSVQIRPAKHSLADLREIGSQVSRLDVFKSAGSKLTAMVPAVDGSSLHLYVDSITPAVKAAVAPFGDVVTLSERAPGTPIVVRQSSS